LKPKNGHFTGFFSPFFVIKSEVDLKKDLLIEKINRMASWEQDGEKKLEKFAKLSLQATVEVILIKAQIYIHMQSTPYTSKNRIFDFVVSITLESLPRTYPEKCKNYKQYTGLSKMVMVSM
jgi:hypothetical protein